MNDNPYAPPTSEVADVPSTQVPAETPPQVRKAIKLYWISLGLGLLNGALTTWRIGNENPSGAVVVSAVIGAAAAIAVTAWLVLKVSAGRNWARIVLMVLAALSIPYFLTATSAAFRISWLDGSLFLAVYGLQYFSMALLYTRASNSWFRSRAGR